MAEGNGNRTQTLKRGTIWIGIPTITLTSAFTFGWNWESDQQGSINALTTKQAVMIQTQTLQYQEVKESLKRIEGYLETERSRRTGSSNQLPSRSQHVTREAREETFNPDYVGASGVHP